MLLAAPSSDETLRRVARGDWPGRGTDQNTSLVGIEVLLTVGFVPELDRRNEEPTFPFRHEADDYSDWGMQARRDTPATDGMESIAVGRV